MREIVLRTGIERASLRGRFSNAAILEVKGNGKGIPLEVQKRLFDPFYTTSPLALASAYQLCV